ncbi:hypothetical protein ACFSRY_19075 [Pontibacter locisalis]|uniref:Uncharacterized protein n=1 Tax=Pontibacter locisalis TaxID=1719035 RepID=A0ABW5IR98_9BACT
MKTILRAILIIVTFCSCNAEVKTETVNDDISRTAIGDSEAQSNRVSQTTGEGDGAKQNGISLIGKTTIEIEGMGWFNCAGTLIDSNQDEGGFWISQLAKSQEECRNGSGKILLQKLISRNGNKAVFEVMDEIDIESSYPEKEYNWTTCKVKEAAGEELYVIHFKDQQQAELTEIHDSWSVDRVAGKFVKVKNSAGVTCVNPDYSEGL